MAYKAPTAAQLFQSLRQEIRAELPGADPFIWPNNLYVVTKMIAQGLRGMYLRLEWLHRQAFASSADGVYLDAIGADTGLARLPAGIAMGAASAAISGSAIEIPAGTRLLRGDNAVFLTVGSAGTVSSGSGAYPLILRALEPGKAGNTDAGTVMALETPMGGVGAVTVGATGLTGGSEEENDQSFRARILHRKQNPPHGGSPSEYVQWAMTMAGVTRVFVRRATPEPGSVTVFFMMDEAYANGIPGSTHVAQLRNLILAEAPASANVIVSAPTAVVVNIEISGLTPNTAVVREAVTAEIRAQFRRRAEPGTADADFVFSRSWIWEAAAMAAGEHRHTVADPTADVTCGAGEIAVLGSISFT